MPKTEMKHILILGAGALGSWLTSHLAIDLKDKAKITVLDFDKVEPRNWQAGTQFYRSDQRDTSKTRSLAFNIWKWENVKIGIVNEKLGKGNVDMLGKCHLVVDTFDNYDSRKLVYEYCKKNKIPCVHVGFSPSMTFEICWNENYEVPDDTKSDFDICTLTGASSFVKMASAMGASTIIGFIENGKKRNFIGNRFSIQEMV